jgi:hypothetical protein
MSFPLKLTLALAVGLIAALLASFVWASGQSSLPEGFGAVMDLRWGAVTMLDLYSGLFFVAGWIAAMERGRPAVALAWLVALLCLGNLATMGYLLLRARRARTFGDLFTPRARES